MLAAVDRRTVQGLSLLDLLVSLALLALLVYLTHLDWRVRETPPPPTVAAPAA
jgi:hypothetical protein